MSQIRHNWPKETDDLRAREKTFWESPEPENLRYWFIFS
jgi:hypothetical protein